MHFRYLRVKSTAKKPAKPVDLDDASESQDQMDDLLNLCSGRFTGKCVDLDDASESQDQMDDLLNLCSGRFTGQY